MSGSVAIAGPLARFHGARVEGPEWFDRAIATPAESGWVTVDRAAIHYLRWGARAKPGLILVHGNGAHAYWWSFIAPFLAREYNVAAIDLSGMGDSAHRDAYTMEHFAHELLAVAEHAGMFDNAEPPIIVGHSFGGRVVTAAAAALAPQTPGVSLTLLQAAYSHNGLAAKFDGEHDGFFRTVVADSRVSGPIVITHTKNDKAVGVAYPLASRIANDKAAAFGDANDPYGGMGRNGAQKTDKVADAPRQLLDLGELIDQPYLFRPGAVYNLNADRFIADHSNITGQEVAAALLAVASVT